MKTLMTTTMLTAFLLSAQTVSAAENEPIIEQYPNGAAVMAAGTVSNLDDDEFKLNYSDGQSVTVEFDKWDWMTTKDDDDLQKYIKNGDFVVVSGTVDKDIFTSNEIDADNVYFRDNAQYYYIVDVNPAYNYNANYAMDEDFSFASVRGKITEIDGNEFTVESKAGEITVDTSDMPKNPMSMNGAKNLQIGDRVYVSGIMDENFYTGKELSATKVVKIQKMNAKTSDNS